MDSDNLSYTESDLENENFGNDNPGFDNKDEKLNEAEKKSVSDKPKEKKRFRLRRYLKITRLAEIQSNNEFFFLSGKKVPVDPGVSFLELVRKKSHILV